MGVLERGEVYGYEGWNVFKDGGEESQWHVSYSNLWKDKTEMIGNVREYEH